MNFVAALAYHFCLVLPAAFTQPGVHFLAEPVHASSVVLLLQPLSQGSIVNNIMWGWEPLAGDHLIYKLSHEGSSSLTMCNPSKPVFIQVSPGKGEVVT